MTPINPEEIIAGLGELTIKEMLELVSTLEAQWGVEAITGGPVTVIETKPAPEVQTSFDVVLVGRGHSRIKLIKALRALMGIGLQEAVQLSENLPETIVTGVDQERAEEVKDLLEEAGASVKIE
jgi:large subunit ribosomal protein L7/L12